MRNSLLLTAAFLGFAAAPAWAQAPATGDGARPGNVIGTGQSMPRSTSSSNNSSVDTSRMIAPALPSPGLAATASPSDFLRAARTALAAGRTGEAQQALEMAETRMLSRSMAPSDARTPSRSNFVGKISDARMALSQRDRNGTMLILDSLLSGTNQANADGGDQMRTTESDGNNQFRPANSDGNNAMRPANSDGNNAMRPANSDGNNAVRPANSDGNNAVRPANSDGNNAVRPANSDGNNAVRPANSDGNNAVRPANSDGNNAVRPANSDGNNAVRPANSDGNNAVRPANSDGNNAVRPANSQSGSKVYPSIKTP
jgi:hypothetical protein